MKMPNPMIKLMKNRLPIPLALAAALLFAACVGNGNVRVREGSEQIGSVPKGTLITTNEVRIVHVDEIERLATLRNGNAFPEGAFLQSVDGGEQTAILKALAKRPTGLRTAYILEGEPDINDTVIKVSVSEKQRLEKLYRDPESE